MKIVHIGIWVKDLERMKSFYEFYFNGKAGHLYYNPAKQFSSYFISFEDGCYLELMHRPDIEHRVMDLSECHGIAHFAISTGSKEKVDSLTEKIRVSGYEVISNPRTTGDGYYESIIMDPEGNRIEITE